MAEPNPVCGHCAAEVTPEICEGCSAIKYCSIECREADWVWHQHLCTEYASFKTKPNANSRLAINLPVGDIKPRFFWIEVDTEDSGEAKSDSEDTMSNPDEAEYDYELEVPLWDSAPCNALADFKGLFGRTRGVDAFSYLVMGKLGAGERLDHSISMAHLDAFHGGPLNDCVSSLIGKYVAPFLRGPVVLYGMTKALYSEHIVDLRPSDFTFALKAMIEHACREYQGTAFLPALRIRSKVKGVKLTTKGTFEVVEIPHSHPIFTEGQFSELSKEFTKPLVTWQQKNNPSAAAYLHLNIRIPASGRELGALPEGWKDGTTTLIARQDRSTLSSTTAQMVCDFCREEMIPFLKDLPGDGPRPPFPTDKVQELWKTFKEKYSKT